MGFLGNFTVAFYDVMKLWLKSTYSFFFLSADMMQYMLWLPCLHMHSVLPFIHYTQCRATDTWCMWVNYFHCRAADSLSNLPCPSPPPHSVRHVIGCLTPGHTHGNCVTQICRLLCTVDHTRTHSATDTLDIWVSDKTSGEDGGTQVTRRGSEPLLW